MPKQFDHLFPQIIDFSNLYEAWCKAAKGKRSSPAAAAFEMNLSDELIRLQRELADETVGTGGLLFVLHP